MVDGEAEGVCGGVECVLPVAEVVAPYFDFRFARFERVVGDGFGLRAADHAALESIGHGEGQFAVEAGIEDEVHFADVLGRGPAEFEGGGECLRTPLIGGFGE